MMKKLSILLISALTLSVGAGWVVCEEAPVKIYSVGENGELTLEREITEASKSGPKLEIKESDRDVLVEDFEDGDMKNRLGGESGTWNLTPYDEEIDVFAEVVDDTARENSEKALRIEYDVDGPDAAKVGFWSKLLGINGRQFDHLALDVRGDTEAGFSTIFLIELKKYKDDKRIDKIKGTRTVTNVTSEWQTVEIPLNLMNGIWDQTNHKIWEDPQLAKENLDEFVLNFESRRVDQKVGALYFDNIRFIKKAAEGEHEVTIMDQPQHSIQKTPVRLEGLDFMRFLANRLGGFPTQSVVTKEFPEDDREFLMEIARDTWKFFDNIVDQETHLPLDTIQLGPNQPFEEGAWVGDYTNVTNIGIYLMCLVSGYDFGFISREDVIERIGNTLDTIEKLPKHKSGFLYNYYDTTLGIRTSYFVSLVDSGWLDAGVYVVKNAFPEELAEQSDRILNSHNFDFFYDDVDQQMSHGFYEHLDVRSDYIYGSFYTEPRATSYIAIGRGDVPAEHWFRLVRTFPEEYPWTTQMPIDREKKEVLGYEFFGGHYQARGLKFIPSWGGSMFEALMPTLVLGEREYAPKGLGLNNANYTKIHMDETLEKLEYPVWGMSPSSVPEGGYSEFGIEDLGAKGYKSGVVTPHASILGLEYEPEGVVRNLRKLIELYPIYGEYGFYDAVTVETGLVAYKYLALDQGMIFVALNNYLNDGAIRKRFHADPINKNAFPLLTEEDFFGSNEAGAA